MPPYEFPCCAHCACDLQRGHDHACHWGCNDIQADEESTGQTFIVTAKHASGKDFDITFHSLDEVEVSMQTLIALGAKKITLTIEEG